MRRAAALAVVMLFGTLAVFAQAPLGQTPKPQSEVSPLQPIAWMAGHWVADAKSPGSDKVSKVDTRYTLQMNGHAMSLETSFDGILVYEGMFAYDPAQKAIAFWYVTPEGESIRGTVDPQQNGDQLYDFQMTLANGVSLHFRTLVHRVDSDHYVWTLFTNSEGTKWDKLIEVNYHRAP